MKEEISSLELYYLVKELQDLKDGRIDKIYQKGREFLLTMHVSRKGKKLLKIIPNLIYITNYKEEFQEQLPGFCKFLRKHLKNSFVKEITQKNFERIIEIVFETKERRYFMIIELFGNGNLILCDEKYKILSALESHKWKDRTVRGGIKYEYPPEQINLFTLNEQNFVEIINKSDKDSTVKALAVDLSLGGLYAEELCTLAKIEKTKRKLKPAELKTAYKKMKELLAKEIKANTSGEEILPFELILFKQQQKKYFSSFSEAVDSKLSQKIMQMQVSAVKETKNKKLEKIQQIINQQEQTIIGLEKSCEENQQKAELLYENYEFIKQILAEINDAREKLSWEEIKEKLKEHKTINRINEKEGKIIVNIV